MECIQAGQYYVHIKPQAHLHTIRLESLHGSIYQEASHRQTHPYARRQTSNASVTPETRGATAGEATAAARWEQSMDLLAALSTRRSLSIRQAVVRRCHLAQLLR